MKLSHIGISALLLLAVNARAQQGVKLAFKYQPNHTYSSTINMKVNGSVKVQGSSPMADSLKAKGIAQNTSIAVNATGNVSVKTGDEAGGNVPVVMTLERISAQPTLNGQQIPVPVGMLQGKKVYAKASADGKLHIDSVSGKHLPDSALARINNMMSMAMSRMQLPDKTFKIGDTYTQEVPLYMPMGGMQPTNAKTKITYRLVKVSGNKAYFNLTQTTDFSDNKHNAQTTVNGSGTGNMVYEINERYPSMFQSDMRVNVHSTSNGGNKGGADAMFTVSTNGTTAITQ